MDVSLRLAVCANSNWWRVADVHLLGPQGIKLWDLQTQKLLTTATPFESRGVVSCATWMKMKHAHSETLCYGTSMGYLIFLQSNPTDVSLFSKTVGART